MEVKHTILMEVKHTVLKILLSIHPNTLKILTALEILLFFFPLAFLDTSVSLTRLS